VKILDLNFVEDFDRIVVDYIEVAVVKIDEAEVEGIHDDVGNEETYNVFDVELKFLEDWLVKDKDIDDPDSVLDDECTVDA